MEKSNFDKLLEKYATNETTPEETAKIEAWLDVAKTENFSEDEFTKSQEEHLFKKITGNLGLNEFKHSLPVRRRRLSSWTIGIAASFLLILSISALVWMISNNSTVEKLILNDGTLVWLKGDSRLNYYEKPNDPTRYAELSGEGLFEVAKDPARPFVIQCGSMTVRVLGTSFNLKVVNDSLYLDVLTGKVKVISEKDSAGIQVVPRERVVFSAFRKVEDEKLSTTQISKITRQTEYNMQFSNVRVTDVLDRMEEKFEVQVKRGKEFKDCPITADFTDHSLESTLKMLSDIIDFTYVVEGKTVTISGNGCN